MKEKLIIFAILLLIMAALPFIALKYNNIENNTVKSSTSDNAVVKTASLNYSDKILCGLVAGEYKNDYCEETMKAIAIIILNNYNINPDSFDTENKSVCIFESDADSSVKEIYPQIINCVNSVKEINVKFNNAEKIIPYSEISNGATNKDNNYEYLTAVASPWDCFDNNYDKNAKCTGVSLNGIDYLCKNGYSAIDALKWYLPKAEIK